MDTYSTEYVHGIEIRLEAAIGSLQNGGRSILYHSMYMYIDPHVPT
jgi:hypothetical protein